jgi:hypothetical protein
MNNGKIYNMNKKVIVLVILIIILLVIIDFILYSKEKRGKIYPVAIPIGQQNNPVVKETKNIPISNKENKNNDQVCCEIFGYGARMVKTIYDYQMMSPGACTTPENLVGGGRNIVDKSFCESRTD